jgi:hypothetical protein
MANNVNAPNNGNALCCCPLICNGGPLGYPNNNGNAVPRRSPSKWPLVWTWLGWLVLRMRCKTPRVPCNVTHQWTLTLAGKVKTEKQKYLLVTDSKLCRWSSWNNLNLWWNTPVTNVILTGHLRRTVWINVLSMCPRISMLHTLVFIEKWFLVVSAAYYGMCGFFLKIHWCIFLLKWHAVQVLCTSHRSVAILNIAALNFQS